MNKFAARLKDTFGKDTFQEMKINFRWILKYIKKYRTTIAAYVILGILGIIMGLGSSVAFKFLVDAVLRKHLKSVVASAVVNAVFALSAIGIESVIRRISVKTEVKLTNEITADLFRNVMYAGWEEIANFKTGDLLNRINVDVKTVTSNVLSGIFICATKIAQFLGAAFIILHYDVTFGLIALVFTPVIVLIYRVLLYRMHDLSKQTKKINSDLMAFNNESFQNIQIIKAFNIAVLRIRELFRIQNHVFQVYNDYNRLSVLTSAVMGFIGLVVSLFCYGWGVYRLWSGFITFGTMTLFVQLSSLLMSSFSAVIGVIPNVISASTSAGRIIDLVELAQEDAEDDNRDLLLNVRERGADIEIKNVSVAYQNAKTVLEHVTLSAKRGEIIALIGSSGSGKTTLFRVLLGLLKAEHGEVNICLDGNQKAVPVSNKTRSLFGYVPQGNTVFSGTIADNLRMTKPDASDTEIRRALDMACAASFVSGLEKGIDAPIGENGIGLSVGQAQRIAIARAFISDAPIILFDEATSALDAATEKAVLDNMLKMSKNQICILSTHRVSVLDICDKVYYVNDGSVRQISIEEAKQISTSI